MFDNIKTIIAGFTGKLQNEPTLRKWFWVFVTAQLFTLIVLWYNAFMSLNFYRQMLSKFADMQGDFLPYLVTISIALIALGEGPKTLSLAPRRAANSAPLARSCVSGPTNGTVDGRLATSGV